MGNCEGCEVFMVNQLSNEHRIEYCTRSADYMVEKRVKYYNWDVIISVGYRVKNQSGNLVFIHKFKCR